jgi:hypothetical protein
MLMVSMVSCAGNPEITKDIYDVEVTYEDVIVDGMYVGRASNYGDYYLLTCSSDREYLVFLDGMEDNIQIIDISKDSYHSWQTLVTYKYLND